MSEQLASLRRLFDAAVAAVNARGNLRPLPRGRVKGRTIVLGAGKAAASMAAEFERQWDGQIEGLVVTRHGHSMPTQSIKVVEASHPVPGEEGQRAAARMLALAGAAGEDDQVVFLGSGGGSALLSLPAPGISLEDKRDITRRLLASGAPIQVINNTRLYLSRVKGGRLAAACAPAPVTSYLICDMPDDDHTLVASGPTMQQHGRPEEALAMLEERGIDVPEHVAAAMLANPNPRIDQGEAHVIARASDAQDAAAELAAQLGWQPLLMGGDVEGDAREVAGSMARYAKSIAASSTAPTVILSGGETTVEVRGQGQGGRNMEFLLALALALEGDSAYYGLACDTDGIDGIAEEAGAVFGPATLRLAREAGLDPLAQQADNDARSVFDAAGHLVRTGPTRTNVNDFRAILVNGG